MTRNSLLVLGGLVAAGISGTAQAATSDNDLTAELVVPSGCMLSTTVLDFGTPAPSATSIDSSAVVTVSCTDTVIFNMEMGNGLNPTGPQRRMLGTGGDHVPYNLYRNASRTLTWGAGLNSLFGAALASVPADFTVYGRVPSVTPSALTGSYSDTVVVTMTF